MVMVKLQHFNRFPIHRQPMLLHRSHPFLDALFPHHDDPNVVLNQSLGNKMLIHQTFITPIQSLGVNADQQFRTLLQNLADLKQPDSLQPADGVLQLKQVHSEYFRANSDTLGFDSLMITDVLMDNQITF